MTLMNLLQCEMKFQFIKLVLVACSAEIYFVIVVLEMRKHLHGDLLLSKRGMASKSETDSQSDIEKQRA